MAVTCVRIVLVALGYLVTNIVVAGCIGVEESSHICAPMWSVKAQESEIRVV